MFDLLETGSEAEGLDYIGERGERIIERKLKWVRIFTGDGLMLRKVNIPKEGGNAAQVGLVFITRIGIFVIESKDYEGCIFGNEEQLYWSAEIITGINRFGRYQVKDNRFYNPIMQNKSNIGDLRKFLNLSANVPFYSITVFSDSCMLKNIERSKDTDAILCQVFQLGPTLRYGIKKKEKILDEGEAMAIYKKLLPHSEDWRDEMARQIREINSKLGV